MSDVPESAVEIPENVTSSTVSDLTKRKYPDGGYGWTIVFCSFLLYLIADGISYPLGLINSAWLDYFHQSETKTSWIGSIFYATPLLSGPFMSKLIEKYGCKKMTMLGGAIGSLGFILSSLCTSVEQLYVTVGLIGGSGLSAAFIVGLLSVERWFESRRGFAIGIVSAGTGFGTFIFPPITQFLLEQFEWKLTMIFLSGLLMTVAIIGAFLDDPVWKVQEDAAMRVERRETKERNVGNPPIEKKFIEQVKTFVDFSHFKNGNFALLGFTTFIIYAFYNTAIYFLVEMLKEFQYTENESAKFLSVTGFFLMLGMLSLGWLADRKSINVVYLNAMCVIACGLCEALMPVVALNWLALSILCAIFGFTFASAYVLIPKLAELICGVDNFASALGLNFFMQGVGLLVGTPFAGWIFEMTGSWPPSFWVSGGVIAASGFMALLIETTKKEEPLEGIENQQNVIIETN